MDVWRWAEINQCGWWQLVNTRPRALHSDELSINSSVLLGCSQGSEETARVWQGSTALADSAQRMATLIPMTKEIWIIAALIWIPLHHITRNLASPLCCRTKPPTFPPNLQAWQEVKTMALMDQSCTETFTDLSAGVMVRKDARVAVLAQSRVCAPCWNPAAALWVVQQLLDIL